MDGIANYDQELELQLRPENFQKTYERTFEDQEYCSECGKVVNVYTTSIIRGDEDPGWLTECEYGHLVDED